MEPRHEHLRALLAKLVAGHYRQTMPLRHLHQTGELLPECNGQENDLIKDGLAALEEELEKQQANIRQIRGEL